MNSISANITSLKQKIYSAIRQTIESQLNLPIKNMGVKGIRHTSKELKDRIKKASDIFHNIDELEEDVYTELTGIIK